LTAAWARISLTLVENGSVRQTCASWREQARLRCDFTLDIDLDLGLGKPDVKQLY